MSVSFDEPYTLGYRHGYAAAFRLMAEIYTSSENVALCMGLLCSYAQAGDLDKVNYQSNLSALNDLLLRIRQLADTLDLKVVITGENEFLPHVVRWLAGDDAAFQQMVSISARIPYSPDLNIVKLKSDKTSFINTLSVDVFPPYDPRISGFSKWSKRK